jgi:3-dehydroquinate synthase
MIEREISVDLGNRSYPVFLGREILPEFGPALSGKGVSKSIVVVTDRHVAPLYLRSFEQHLRQSGFSPIPIVIPPGEQQKSLSRAGRIFTELLKAHVGREAAIVALGGGVIGDLAGFVAATYKRGIQLVHVPTTLLAQVDSSVGGKVAVNHPLGKNMIGAFHQPVLVWIDAQYLGTLPRREVVCGIGEVVKYAVAFDEDLFAFLENKIDSLLTLEPKAISYVQTRCLEIKSRIVSEDERESGIRSFLNLGHTIGHGLEAAGKYKLLKHGEAVLLGIAAEGYIARELGLIPDAVHRRIAALVARAPIRAEFRKLNSREILKALEGDKKSINGKNRFVLPAGVGQAKLVEGVDRKLIVSSLQFVRSIPQHGRLQQ